MESVSHVVDVSDEMAERELVVRSDCGSGEGRGCPQSHTGVDCSKPSLTWKGPLETVINSNTVHVANKNGSKRKACFSNSSSESKHHHKLGNRSKPRSESDSHRCHHRRLSPTFKKKYSSVHPSMSPVASSPKCRSLGKMWIRPVPVRQGANDHVCQSGKCVVPVHPPQLPLFPSFDSNQVTCAQDSRSLVADVRDHHHRRLSNDSSSSMYSPIRATSPVNIGVDGTSCFYPFSSPNSSFEQQDHRHVRCRHSSYFGPESTHTKTNGPIAFGESGKPITSFKRLGQSFQLYPENFLRMSGVSSSPTTVLTNTWHHGQH